jgi:CheY-like chemotaxis protein
MNKTILLADDDSDDCLLFEDAVREVSSDIQITTAKDGMELMDILEETVPPPPDVIFLDLNMPRKSGYECLAEIKGTQKFRNIPVVILSTSSQADAIDEVYHNGADFYIRKPGSFPKLKQAIQQILSVDWTQVKEQSSREKFFLNF